MAKKKKHGFIDKKTAHRFVLMHRSQQDPLYYDEEGSKIILHPADEKTAKALERLGMNPDGTKEGLGQIAENYTKSSEVSSQAGGAKEFREINELGLPNDGYDYSKHMATIGPGGTFISKDGTVSRSEDMMFTARPTTTATKSSIKLPDAVLASEREHERLLESITLRPETMDRDLQLLLEEAEAEESDDDAVMMNEGTLDDDFMEQLIDAEQNAPDDDDAFDYDAHVARLMKQAELEDDEEFDSDDEDGDHDVDGIFKRASESRQARDVDAHFETLLSKEYTDDQIGELENAWDDEAMGGILENDSDRVQQALCEYMDAMQLDKTRGKLEIGATSSNKGIREVSLQQVQESEEDEEDEVSEQVGHLDGDVTITDEEKQELLEKWGYKDRPVEKWDCETIVSTYSTLDNHPQLIQSKSKLKKKKPVVIPAQKAEDATAADTDELEDDDDASQFTSATVSDRNKNETSEEKRLRKKMVKEARRNRRVEKKVTKQLYKDERLKQEMQLQKTRAAAAPPPGASVFRL